MKKIILGLLLVGSVSLFAQQLETRKTYYDIYKTVVHEVYSVIKNTNTKQGEYKSYDGDGSIRVVCNFKNGNLDGTYKEYYETHNTLQAQYIYNNGELVEQTEYWANGDKSYHKVMKGIWTLYAEGVKYCDAFLYEGGRWGDNNAYKPEPKDYYLVSGENTIAVKKCIYYYPSGKIAHEDKFNPQYISSESRSYSEDGQVTYERLKSENDDTYIEKFYSTINGKLYMQIGRKLVTIRKPYEPYKIIREGLTLIYDTTGNLVSEGNYKNDHRVDRWKILYKYDSNLKRLIEVFNEDEADRVRSITYNNEGKPIGQVMDISMATGEKMWEGFLVSEQPDKYDGFNTYYYTNGNKQKEISYKNGKIEGVIKYYYESGKPSKEQTVLGLDDYTGEPTLIETVCWYENGQKKSESHYHTKNDDDDSSGKLKYYTWEYWYENGILSETGDYKEGYKDKKIGIWKTYTKDGSLSNVSYYDNNGSGTSKLLKTESVDDYLKGEYSKLILAGDKKREVFKNYDVSDKRTLWNSYIMVQNTLVDKMRSSSDYSIKLQYAKQLDALYDKMIGFKNQDTEAFEKLLKKEKDFQKTLELFGL